MEWKEGYEWPSEQLLPDCNSSVILPQGAPFNMDPPPPKYMIGTE